MEKLIIKNFGGIKKAEIPLNRINVFIGPQASGKSIAVKLIYFFQEFWTASKVFIEKDVDEIIEKHEKKFIKYFPVHTWPEKKFEIIYSINDLEFHVYKKGKKIKLEVSDNIIKLLKETKSFFENNNGNEVIFEQYEKIRSLNKFNNFIRKKIGIDIAGGSQIFIPAGRGFFSNISKNIFSLTEQQVTLEPFLVHFGRILEMFKELNLSDKFFLKDGSLKYNYLSHEILKGEFIRDSGEEYILHEDNRKVKMTFVSSGQQEIYPLLIILTMLLDSRLISQGIILYVEEPEAHLFPRAQKNIVRLLGKLFNTYDGKIQIHITTHSPYILTSFNNLIYGGSLEDEFKNDKKKLEKLYSIYPKDELIKPEFLSAFSFGNGVKNIMDKETKLIDQNVLDEISNEIAMEFDQLLDLKYGEK